MLVRRFVVDTEVSGWLAEIMQLIDDIFGPPVANSIAPKTIRSPVCAP
jgi:hypothetical protein